MKLPNMKLLYFTGAWSLGLLVAALIYGMLSLCSGFAEAVPLVGFIILLVLVAWTIFAIIYSVKAFVQFRRMTQMSKDISR